LDNVPKQESCNMNETDKTEGGQVAGRRALIAGAVGVGVAAVGMLAGEKRAAAGEPPIRLGTKELSFVIEPDTGFDQMIGILKEALTIPHLPGVKGCAPCFSGLDRFVLLSKVLER
jgi:hypothetical protein